MKIEIRKQVAFFQLNQAFALRLKPLLNYLQEAAAAHANAAGENAGALMRRGKAWMLHRMDIEIGDRPTLGDELRVVTWHRGHKGFRAYRDFEIFRGTEKIISATSTWLLIALERKKILKIPKDTDYLYQSEHQNALESPTENQRDERKSGMDFKPDTEQTLTIRPSDYDPLGHVNNAVYFDLLEACIETAYPPETDIRRITMQFNKEIGREIQTVEIGFKANGKNDTQFRIVQNNCIHAAGEMNLISK